MKFTRLREEMLGCTRLHNPTADLFEVSLGLGRPGGRG